MHLGLTAPTVGQAFAVVGAAIALQSALNLLHWNDARYATAATVLILTAVLSITYRGRTLPGWIAHRRSCTRRTPRLTQVLSHDGTALLWDHTTNRASILIAITAKPFAVSLVDESGGWLTNSIDLDAIRAELRQFDIQLHDLTLVTIGYTYAGDTNVSKIAFTTTGPINALTYGRTFLRVTLDTAQSATSITAREIDHYSDPKEALAAGLARTVQLAASRAHRALTLQGFIAKKLTKTEAYALHDELVELLGADALAQEGFTHAGRTAPHLVAFTPTRIGAGGDSTHSEWLRATTEVCLSITRMAPTTGSEDIIEQYYCNRVDRLDTVALAEANNLRREYGQHAAIATTALPLAAAPHITAVPHLPIATTARSGLDAVPGGVGIYLGHTDNGTDRVWIDLSVPSHDPLWIIGDRRVIEMLLIRAAPLGLRIDVRTPELDPIRRALRNDGVGLHETPDIALSAVGDPHHPTAPVRIIWSPTPIEQKPRYLIDATTPGRLHIRTPDIDQSVRWKINSAEASLLGRPATARR